MANAGDLESITEAVDGEVRDFDSQLGCLPLIVRPDAEDETSPGHWHWPGMNIEEVPSASTSIR
jgi:hypothetical protein